MAAEKNILQQIIKVAYAILEPFVELTGGTEAEREEMLVALGLDPALSNSFPTIPASSLNSLNAYVAKAATEVDELAFAAAVKDLMKISAALKSFSVMAAAGNSNLAASELVTGYMNLLTLNYVRHEYPVFHKVISILEAFDEQSIYAGGIVNLGSAIGSFFDKMGQGFDLDSEESTTDMSHAVLFFSGVVITLLNRFVFRRFGIPLVIDAAYGYDGILSCGSTNADMVSQRTLSFSIRTIASEDASGKLTNTLAFIPQTQGGPAAMMYTTGQMKLTVDLGSDWKFSVDSGGLGEVYRIGNGAMSNDGSNPYVKFLLEKDTDEKTMGALFDAPLMKFGYARTKFGLQISKDDIEVRFWPTIALLFDRGGLTGFPWFLIPAKGFDQKFDVSMGFSLKKGFFLDGAGSGLTLAIPLYASVGDATTFEFALEVITIAYSSDEAAKTNDVELSLSFRFTIASIITATISRIGALFTLEEDAEGAGMIVGYNINPSFKWPNGIGVAVDADVVKGGGYLYFDSKKGEYFGAMELSFPKLFTLKAIGIINTKMPDGSDGFSMLIIITAEDFNWQLGMGFKITGFGGILGLQRTVKVEALVDGLKTNTLKSILFPKDVLANITRIISDLKQVFPIEKDHFLIGPMVKMGWGTPTLISLELGVIIDFPDPRVITLGVLRITLPAEDAPVLRMQANFIGIIDIPNGYVFFRADLCDSRLLLFTLTGSIAFLVSWGEKDTLFAMSVGGFHPDFTDVPAIAALPNGFKNLDRVGISLLSGSNPRITILSYHAVTSNSVQFGSKVELYAEAAGFNVYGYLGYDVLFKLDPFEFIAGIYAGLALRSGSDVIMSISLSGKLSGPKPWRVKGEASFSILFFDVTIGFDETWGEDPDALVVVKEDLQALMETEIKNNQNWVAVIPQNNSLHVSIRDTKLTEPGQPPSPNIVIHPVGVLTFSERAVPLDVEIEKYGTRVPKDVRKFHITSVKSGNAVLARQDVKEKFAPAHYFELKDNEKLARRSFETFNSGFKVKASSELHLAPAVNKSVDYEISYLRKKKFKIEFAGIYKYQKARFKSHLKGNAVANSGLSYASNRPSPNAPEAVNVKKEQYVVANKSDMKPYSAELVADSYAEAATMYKHLTTKQPSLKNKVRIILQYEQNLN